MVIPIITILLNCMVVLGVYLGERRSPAKQLPYMAKQLIIGVLFGCVYIFSLHCGIAGISICDAATLSAGIIFGAPAGIVSGVIGGLYCWFSPYLEASVYTQIADTASAVFVGLLAAVLRMLMFDNKRATWGCGFSIAIVCEVMQAILIFLTNNNNASSDAFLLIKESAIPGIFSNAFAVGVAILLISIVSGECFKRERGGVQLAHTFQHWLLAYIAVACVGASAVIFIQQNEIAESEIQKEFEVAIEDIESKVENEMNLQLLTLASMIKQEYQENPNLSMDELAEMYGINEINVVNREGMVINSTEEEMINQYDMNSKLQSKAFMDAMPFTEFFVQKYGPKGGDTTVRRKYAAIRLDGGGFIQVGYNEESFEAIFTWMLNEAVENYHVGVDGFIIVCDENLNTLAGNTFVYDEEMFLMSAIEDENTKRHISALGIDPPEEMKAGRNADTVYYADIVDENTGVSTTCMYLFKFIEGYCIIAAMPEEEAMFMRDASIYTSIFMQILIFAALFVCIYVLVKKIVINNLRKVNDALKEITAGDLDVVVDVRTNQEFVQLSDDINQTVSALKQHIANEAARIDKELEYAKQIQLSALPTDFPLGEDYSIYAQMIAAKEVGGDFYDFYRLDEKRVAFLAADVSGKGIPAALFMMRAKTAIKALAESGLTVNEIFTQANEQLCENNEANMFVTAWMGILDLTTGKLQFANAGHNPPLLKRADGSFAYLKTRPGFVLAGMEGIRYRAEEITLFFGDRVFLYTDGVSEATNIGDELYGEDRLLAFMNRNADEEAQVLLPALKADIDAFAGEAPQFDDITMLLFDYKAQLGGVEVTNRIFAAKQEVLPEVLDFVEKMLDEYGCSMKMQRRICIAIEEVFVNIANYAYGEEEGDVAFDIGFDKDSNTMTFRISDRGVPFNPLEKADPDITLSAEEREIGGLGIFITKKIMDTVTYAYEDGKNILTMIKSL